MNIKDLIGRDGPGPSDLDIFKRWRDTHIHFQEQLGRVNDPLELSPLIAVFLHPDHRTAAALYRLEGSYPNPIGRLFEYEKRYKKHLEEYCSDPNSEELRESMRYYLSDFCELLNETVKAIEHLQAGPGDGHSGPLGAGGNATPADGSPSVRSGDGFGTPQNPSKQKTEATINARMIDILTSDHESVGWPVRKWAEKLRCSEGAIHKSPTWKMIMKRREDEKISRGLRGNDSK